MKKLLLSSLLITTLSIGSSVWGDITESDAALNENLDKYMPVYLEHKLSSISGRQLEFKIIDRVKIRPEPYYTSAGAWVGYAQREGSMLHVTFADRDYSGSDLPIDHVEKVGDIPLVPGTYTLEYTYKGLAYNDYYTIEVTIEEQSWPLKVEDSGFIRFTSTWEDTPVYLIKYTMKKTSKR